MNFSNIDSSLQYGKVPSKREYAVLWVFFSVLILLPLITIGVIITVLCGYMNWDKEIENGLILANLMFCFFMLIDIYIIHYYNKLYNNIELWLEDAVETSAFVRRMDAISSKYRPFQVAFCFKAAGREYRRLSASGGLIIGLNKRFLKYDNKTVNILYSPKYDQVLVLKN